MPPLCPANALFGADEIGLNVFMTHATQRIEAADQSEKMHLVREIVRAWRLVDSKVQQIFIDEPGVVVLKKNRRAHLRIPDSVRQRVLSRLTNKA